MESKKSKRRYTCSIKISTSETFIGIRNYNDYFILHIIIKMYVHKVYNGD